LHSDEQAQDNETVRSLGGDSEQEDANAHSDEEIRNDICYMANPPPLHGNREIVIDIRYLFLPVPLEIPSRAAVQYIM
jgi:hypothetical protein